MANELSPDIYNITGLINDIHKKFNEDVSEDTLSMGMYGYIQDILSRISQNSIIMASEWGNEGIMIRSKFEKTILANAVTYNIDSLNAIPAKMEVMIGFVESELIEKMGNKNYIIIDKNHPFMIDKYEFHLDYDLYIGRVEVENNKFVYTARYILSRNNPLSDITDPYISSPIKRNVSNSTFIFVNCKLRQVNYTSIEKNIISDSFIDNKTFDFEFDNQMAYFDISVVENNTTTMLTPVFDGMPPDELYYCFYSYLDSNNIRVKFDRNSYQPRSSAKVNVQIYTTLGMEGNFYYNDDIITSISSEKYEYDGLMCLITPISESYEGVDRKSIDDISKILPKQALSRGTINCNKDLENYFYSIDNTRLYFYKKIHNQFERMYYAYMIMMDENNNVVPTNTLPLKIYRNNVDSIIDGRMIIKPGKKFIFNPIENICEIKPTNEIINPFEYASPFTIVINTDPFLTISYYSTNIDKKNYFDFTYINEECPLQFISKYIHGERHYLKNNDKYVFTIDLLQNIAEDFGIIEVDKESNKILEQHIKVMMLLENDDSKYYVEGKLEYFNSEDYSYRFVFELDNDNAIDKYNRIRINNVKKLGDGVNTYSFFDKEINIKIYTYIDNGTFYGDNGVSYFSKDTKGYSLTNVFQTREKVDLYHNYTENINSTVKVCRDKEKSETYYSISSSPLIRYSYIMDIDRSKEILRYLNIRKVFIDDAVNIVEDSFSVDLKFFNTYGESKMFKIGHKGKYLDRTNLTMNFALKLLKNSDKTIIPQIKKAIKDYIENINNVSSIHMNNLTTYIKEKFSSNIEFIEFLGINDYNATYQYLEKIDIENTDQVPEFVNVNLLDDGTADINIITV